MREGPSALVRFACCVVLLAACSRSNPDFDADAGVDLAGADLTGLDLSGTQDLTGADLTGVDLATVDLVGADLTPPPFQLDVADTSLTEGDDGMTAMVFTVTLAPAASVPVTFDYATSDGTARVDTGDYLGVVGRLTIPAGETSVDVVVPVQGDLRDEANEETLSLTLTNPVNAGLGRATAMGTITDDDDPPTVNIDDAAAYEGANPATGGAIFRVWLSAPSGRDVAVMYATASGSAGASDYTAKSGTLMFAPGETEKWVSVPITADVLAEGTETFSMVLSSPTSCTIGNGDATGTIYDDDQLVPVLSVAAVQVNEGDAGTTDMVFTISSNVPAPAEIAFHVATHDGSATDGLDYMGVDTDLTIPVAGTSAAITVKAIGDVTYEGNESFTLVLSNVQNATASVPMVLGRIKDDDQPPTLTFMSPADPEGNLGASLQHAPFTLSQPSGVEARFQIATVNQSANAPVDYATTSGVARVPPGFDAWDFAVPLHGDTSVEADETYRVQASMLVNAKVIGSGQVACTILNDD